MKREVFRPDLWSNFFWQRRYYHFKNNFLLNDHVFNNFNFFLFAIGLSTLAGLIRPQFWAISLSLICYMVYAWVRTKKLANGITIKRFFEPRGREKDIFEIHYEISNETGFTLPAFSFSQGFEGVQEGMFTVNVPTVSPQTRKRVTVPVTLNGGMGMKEIGDFTIRVHDELSLFPYRLDFTGTAEVEVHPLILETPALKKSISPDSTEFGFYDIDKRGDSSLFIGTREYRHGDPVKHINWKLSQKTQKLIINEFEKNTNTYVTLLLELELSSQVGMGAISTWEAAKDLALSIAASEMRNRNYIQVLAQDLYIPFGTGHEQMVTMERHFTFNELSGTGLSHLSHLRGLPTSSQVYFLCPLLSTENIRETLAALRRLRHLGHSVTVIALDPFESIRKTVSRHAHTPFLVSGRQSQVWFEKTEVELRSHGIHFVRLEVGEVTALRDLLRIHGQQILEENQK